MIQFYDTLHKEAYYRFLKQDITSPSDCERQSLFYLLALMPTTRQHIDKLYDFNHRSIIVSGLNASFQTSGAAALTKLAFTLYNGFQEMVYRDVDSSDLLIKSTHDQDNRLFFNQPMCLTEYQSFNLIDMFAPMDRDLFPYLYDAINIRFCLINGI